MKSVNFASHQEFWYPLPRIYLGEILLIFPVQHWDPFSCWMETFGQGPGCGTGLALGELTLVLSSHSVEWIHLVTYYDVEPVLHWGNSALCWVAILLNGTSGQGPGCGTNLALGELSLVLSSHSSKWNIWSRTRIWNRSCIGGTRPCVE